MQMHRIYKLCQYDILTKFTGGGGGIGDPAEREPEKVREDVLNEFVSLQAARDIYKVVLNPKTLEIDQVSTRKLRGV
jgi:N-methylhydantoinase B